MCLDRGRSCGPSYTSAIPLCSGALCDQTIDSVSNVGLGLYLQATPCAQLPEVSSVIQVTENPLPLKSVLVNWQSASPSWVTHIVLSISCGVVLFLQSLLCLESDPVHSTFRKHRNIRKVRNPWPRPKQDYRFSLIISTFLNHLERLWRGEK